LKYSLFHLLHSFSSPPYAKVSNYEIAWPGHLSRIVDIYPIGVNMGFTLEKAKVLLEKAEFSWQKD
jgi:hypothetical protein